MNSNVDAAVVMSEDLTEKNFGILANDKMFSILSSKIYSDKIAAPIRELSCNAYDAHVAAKKKDDPFNVHLPTWEEMFFAVEDFGPGMDAYEIEELYTTYGYSSKTNSNRFVGCLGLGSKSPFAYTDSFKIVSRKKGKEYLYQCLIDNGMPKLIKFDEKATSEPSGVKIQFDVNSCDIYSFQWKAADIFKYFKVRPIFNIEVGIADYPEFTDGIYLKPKDAYRSCVLMGNVAYNYDKEQFGNKEEYNEFYDRFKYVHTILKAEIGEVEIAASRESVEMSDKTMDFIAKKHLEYADKIAKEMKDSKSSFKSTLEYLFAYGKFVRNHRFIDRKDFYNEVKSFTIPIEGEAEIVRICNVHGNDYTRFANKIQNEFKMDVDFFMNNKVKFVYIPEGRLVSSQGINDMVKSSKGLIVYLFNNESLKKALNAMEYPVYEKKDFAIEKSACSPKEILKDAEGLTKIMFDYYVNCGMKFETVSQAFLDKINDAETIYYIKTKFRSIHFDEIAKWNGMNLKDNAIEAVARYIRQENPNTVFVGINADRAKKIANDPKYVNLLEYVKTNFPKSSEEFERIQKYVTRKNLQVNFGLLFHIKFNKDNFPVELQNILELVNMNDDYTFSLKEEAYKNIYFFDGNISTFTQSLTAFIKNRYPMMAFVTSNYSYNYYKYDCDNSVAIIQDYIDEIDEKLSKK